MPSADTAKAPKPRNVWSRSREPFRDADDIPVARIGGTFKAGALILEPLAHALPKHCHLVTPAHEPALGPALILRKNLNR